MNNSDELLVLPHAPIAEKAVLSRMMHETRRLGLAASEGIGAAAFYKPGHLILWRALRDAGGKFHSVAANDEEDFDLKGFVQELHTSGKLDSVGGASAVAGVYDYEFSSGGWSIWVQQLLEAQAHREARVMAVGVAEANTPQEAVDLAAKALESMQGLLTGGKRSVAAKEACSAFMDGLRDDYNQGAMPGAVTGIHCIDTVTGGMRPGELWVVGARPSGGKSLFMLQIVAEAIQRGETVAVFSLEMLHRELIGRLVSCVGMVNFSSITQPRLATKQDMEKIQRAAGIIAATNLWIDDRAGQTHETICGEAERIRDMAGELDLVVVDYLQLIRGGRSKNETREEEIARASGNLKQLAKRLRCPVLTASQLNDEGKTRESRAIEQDADVLLIIADDGIAVKKQRNGRRGDVLPLRMDGAHQRFTES